MDSNIVSKTQDFRSLPFSRFNCSIDPIIYDVHTIKILTKLYKSNLQLILSNLQNIEFGFTRLNQIHQEELDLDLIFRHSFPFLVTETSFFPSETHSITAIVILLLYHTLSLKNLDFRLDNSIPWARKTSSILISDSTQAMCHALTMQYHAAILSAQHPFGAKILKVALPISKFILERMHQDYIERYDWNVLQDPSVGLKRYNSSQFTRLMGSGYWEIGVRVAFLVHGQSAPPEFDEISKKMRMLRQLTDEIADVHEDIFAGFLTYPMLLLLDNPHYSNMAKEIIKVLWSDQNSTNSLTSPEYLYLHKILEESEVFEKLYKDIDLLWKDLSVLIEQNVPVDAFPLFISLIDLKRAFLERIRINGWFDKPLNYDVGTIFMAL